MNTPQTPGGIGQTDALAGLALGAALLAMGLIAGVYYAYACSVMPGLAGADDRTLVDVMQRINIAIVNPVFMFSFFGALTLPVLAAVLERRLGRTEAAVWIIGATVLYFVSLVTTVAFNIPLNDALAGAGDPHRIADIAALRQRFEAPWITWNIVRAVLCTAALGCIGRALVLHGRG